MDDANNNKNLNIYAKMSKIISELEIVPKNLTVKTSANGFYKAVAEIDILKYVKPLEIKYNIYSYPFSRRILESNLLESETKYKDQTIKKTTFMTRIETVYRFVNIDNPSEHIDIVSFAEGIDSQDKGSGKAMTYSDKYALMKAYKISTGEDIDNNVSNNNYYQEISKSKINNNKNISYRIQLVKKLKEKGIDINNFAQLNKLTEKTTEEEYKKLLLNLED